MKNVLLSTLILIGLVSSYGCSQHKIAKTTNAPLTVTPVSITTVKLGNISETLPVTGNLVALQDVQLSAKQSGRVASVLVREGDSVHAGELVIQQDTADLTANVSQAQANLLSARASLSQAVTNYQIQVTSAKQGVLQAASQVEGAKQAYNKQLKGARPQEILESKSSLLSAQATLKNDTTTLNRDRTLFAQGAIAKADLDTAQTNYDVALQQFNNASAATDLVLTGNRQEDIASALATLRQQQTNYVNALAAVKQVSVKQDAIAAAKASILQFTAALSYARVQLANASIVSPINGIVAARTTEAGQIASPGTSLMRIVNLSTITFQPSISETVVSKVKVGSEVDTVADALPSKVFKGRITAIFPSANNSDRSFTVRVGLANPNGELKPGMFARGNVITAVHRNVPIVPVDTLVIDSTQAGYIPNTSSDQMISASNLVPPQHLVIARSNNTALVQPVKIGIINSRYAEILSGAAPGQKIVEIGQTTLNTGDKISIQNEAHGYSGAISNSASEPAR